VSTSFEMPELDVLTTGTVGPPGQRVFFIQARRGVDVISLRLEKQQVAAMADYLEGMLQELAPSDPADRPAGADLELATPVVAEWVVGALAVAYDADADRLVVVAEELVEEGDEGEEGEEGASARLRATRAQIAAFVDRARDVVSAGRPPCEWCGLPLDPEGHVCPKTNGHRPH
jgi:uncharacterized repeat protein (TIGR03847 family)